MNPYDNSGDLGDTPSSGGVSITDITNTLRRTITGPEFTSAGQYTRTPFMFTSRQRLVMAQTDLANVPVQSETTTDSMPNSTNADSLPVVKMAVNPQTLRWTQGKRISRKDTRDGSVFFHFTNSKGQDNDLARVEFSGATGNINLTSQSIDFSKANQNKLIQWHELWRLTREEQIFMNQQTGVYEENAFYVMYKTRLFPAGIRLTGIFDKPLEWEESAEHPLMARYSFSFIVFDTSPSIDRMADFIRSYSPGAAL